MHFAFISAFPIPNPEFKSVRHRYRIWHLDFTRILYVGTVIKMVSLIHDSVEPIIQYLTVFFAFFPGSISRHMQIFIAKKANDASERLGNNGAIPAFELPATIRTPNARYDRKAGSLGQVDDAKLADKARPPGGIGHQSALMPIFHMSFHYPEGVPAAP